jgi:hypothetical protein
MELKSTIVMKAVVNRGLFEAREEAILTSLAFYISMLPSHSQGIFYPFQIITPFSIDL